MGITELHRYHRAMRVQVDKYSMWHEIVEVNDPHGFRLLLMAKVDHFRTYHKVGSEVRSIFIGKGFSPSLVVKVIEEKGNDDAFLLLENLLIEYFDVQKPNSQSTDHFDDSFVRKDVGSYLQIYNYIQPKEKSNVFDEEDLIEKRASLIMMHFSIVEVKFALHELAEAVHLNELVNFIITAQATVKLEAELEEDSLSCEEENDQNATIEVLFETVMKIFSLIEMGSSKYEVSIVFENYIESKRLKEVSPSDVPVSTPQMKQSLNTRKRQGEMSKQDYVGNASFFVDHARLCGFELLRPFKSNACKSVNKFLYGVEPKLVDTQLFSSFNRNKVHVHNLPTENMFHILPRPPLTIQDVISHTKRWWPSWDTRKQLNCMRFEVLGAPMLCDRLGNFNTKARRKLDQLISGIMKLKIKFCTCIHWFNSSDVLIGGEEIILEDQRVHAPELLAVLVLVYENVKRRCHYNPKWLSLPEQSSYLLGDAPSWLLPVSVFCPLYKHKLRIVGSEEFYEQEKPCFLKDLRFWCIWGKKSVGSAKRGVTGMSTFYFFSEGIAFPRT
ncbi:hypothetical protein GQ457_09G007600 [Hibiscus cannabinus]